MIRGPTSSASTSAVSDQAAQVGSSMKMSSSTFASTRTPPARGSVVVTASERHDLVGGHFDRSRPAHLSHDLLAPAGAGTHQARTALVQLEVDLTARSDPESLANVPWNRHLTLARHSHGNKLSTVIPVRITSQSEKAARRPSRSHRQTAETCSSSATRKDEPQPQAATTLGFDTLKPAPWRLSS